MEENPPNGDYFVLIYLLSQAKLVSSVKKRKSDNLSAHQISPNISNFLTKDSVPVTNLLDTEDVTNQGFTHDSLIIKNQLKPKISCIFSVTIFFLLFFLLFIFAFTGI